MAGEENTLENIVSMLKNLQSELKSVNEKLGSMETKLSSVETKLGLVETRLGFVEGETKHWTENIRYIESKIDRVKRDNRFLEDEISFIRDVSTRRESKLVFAGLRPLGTSISEPEVELVPKSLYIKY